MRLLPLIVVLTSSVVTAAWPFGMVLCLERDGKIEFEAPGTVAFSPLT